MIFALNRVENCWTLIFFRLKNIFWTVKSIVFIPVTRSFGSERFLLTKISCKMVVTDNQKKILAGLVVM